MKRRLLLFLSTGHLQAQLMANGKITAQHQFPDSPEGREDFTAFLKTAECPAYLLVDLVEEDFRHESVPHLTGNHRRALLQRKFEQYYRGTLFHLSTLLQRQKTGRRDDDMLLSALTNPAPIMPWLDTMQAQQTPLAGIYSVAQISAPLVEDHPSRHLLLITWEKLAGLRQSYFSERHLKISRLTPVHARLSYQDAIVKELARTYQYLKSLSLLPEGQILDVRILSHADEQDLLQAALPNHADMRYEFADIAQVAGRRKIAYRFIDSDASQIFLHELASNPPKTSYANADHRHYFNLLRLRNSLNWFSGLILLFSLLWSTTNAIQNTGKSSASDELRIQAQHIFDEALHITQRFPNTHAPAANMKSAVTILRKLEQDTADPQDILQPISAVLGQFPQIELNHLGWQIDTADIPSGNTPTADPIHDRTITLEGNLQGFDSDYRTALAYLDRFQRGLIAIGYQVTIIAGPLDVSPGGALSDRRETGGQTLDFHLHLVWKSRTASGEHSHETL
jgi:hypothetical protein